MKWNKGKIRSIYEQLQTQRKLNRMDELWSLYGGGCFGLHPPSFYHKHSEEEIERIQKEEIAKLKEILNEFQIRNEQNE